MPPDGVMRVVVYVLGIVVFVGGLFGFDFNMVATEIPNTMNEIWMLVGAIIAAGRGIYEMVRDALANRETGGLFSAKEEDRY